MTKQEIKDNLTLIKHYLEGKAKNKAHQSDDIHDYHHGKSEAYKDITERID